MGVPAIDACDCDCDCDCTVERCGVLRMLLLLLEGKRVEEAVLLPGVGGAEIRLSLSSLSLLLLLLLLLLLFIGLVGWMMALVYYCGGKIFMFVLCCVESGRCLNVAARS